MVWPVMNDDSSLTRNVIALAMSSGCPTRRTGVMSALRLASSSAVMPRR